MGERELFTKTTKSWILFPVNDSLRKDWKSCKPKKQENYIFWWSQRTLLILKNIHRACIAAAAVNHYVKWRRATINAPITLIYNQSWSMGGLEPGCLLSWKVLKIFKKVWIDKETPTVCCRHLNTLNSIQTNVGTKSSFREMFCFSKRNFHNSIYLSFEGKKFTVWAAFLF